MANQILNPSVKFLTIDLGTAINQSKDFKTIFEKLSCNLYEIISKLEWNKVNIPPTALFGDETLQGLNHTGKIYKEKMDGFQKAIRCFFSPTKLLFVLPLILFFVWLKIYISIKTC